VSDPESQSVLTDELYTVAEVAEVLKLNLQTVRNWIDAGKPPAFRIGRRVRIKREVLQGILEHGSLRIRPDLTAARNDQLARRRRGSGVSPASVSGSLGPVRDSLGRAIPARETRESLFGRKTSESFQPYGG
jgi:excisionase family DNA binding protein